MLTCSLADETIVLLPERAIYWPARRVLLLADLHLGKDAALRAAGAPIPGGTTEADLRRLDAAIARCDPAQLIVLGDLRHARAGSDETALHQQFIAWRAAHATREMLLVRGNHDRAAGDPPEPWQIDCVAAPYHIGPFALAHEPEPSAGRYTLAGHLHPAFALRGVGRQRLKLPCFWLGERVGVLPAFSNFTAGVAIAPRPGDRIAVIADDAVLWAQGGRRT